MKKKSKLPAPLALQALRRPRSWLAGWMLGMLLAMQALGLAHAVAHASRHATGPGAATSLASATTENTGFFGTHEAGSSDCQLYDQLVHGDLASLPSSGWDAVRSPGVSVATAPSAPRRAATRRFCARDPPPGPQA